MNLHKEEFRSLLLELISIPNESREATILSRLDQISPDPDYLDYIYDSMDYYDSKGEIDIDAVTEKVFSYKPIVL